MHMGTQQVSCTIPDSPSCPPSPTTDTTGRVQPPAGRGGQGQICQLDAAAIQHLLQAQQQVRQGNSHVEEKTNADPTGHAKVSICKQDRMKIMCGIAEEAFPKWYHDIFGRNRNERTRLISFAPKLKRATSMMTPRFQCTRHSQK